MEGVGDAERDQEAQGEPEAVFGSGVGAGEVDGAGLGDRDRGGRPKAQDREVKDPPGLSRRSGL